MMRRLIFLVLVFVSLQTAQAQMGPLSAAEFLPELRAHATQNYAGDSYLVQVLFLPFTFQITPVRYEIPYGIANGWFYRFYSPTRGGHAVYYAYRNLAQQVVIVSPPTGVTVPPFPGQQPLSDTWLDSPLANEAMRNAGADAFIQVHPGAKVTLATVEHHTTGGMLWSFYLVDGVDSLLCRVDAVSGQSAVCGPPSITRIEGLASPVSLEFQEIYPHPVSNGVQTGIAFRLQAAGRVELQLYDLQGRHVATPYADAIPAGLHTVRWQPQGLSPGLYMLRLASAKERSSKAVIIK